MILIFPDGPRGIDRTRWRQTFDHVRRHCRRKGIPFPESYVYDTDDYPEFHRVFLRTIKLMNVFGKKE